MDERVKGGGKRPICVLSHPFCLTLRDYNKSPEFWNHSLKLLREKSPHPVYTLSGDKTTCQ